ncbi:hypothetical protein TRIUR3_13470 [Triticum urartu]|uniref:Uncharacterized protein n=1 Tax=Triticum urartu TaxID=4572 RepID=M7ZT32_TRIUA|nr:hypothetical protein TRIUR3_13470 [Triticum urartu]
MAVQDMIGSSHREVHDDDLPQCWKFKSIDEGEGEMGGGTRAAWRSVAAVAGGRGREGRPDEGSVVFRGQSSPGEGPGCSASYQR